MSLKVIRRENAMNNEIACGIMFGECLFDIGLYNEDYKVNEGMI